MFTNKTSNNFDLLYDLIIQDTTGQISLSFILNLQSNSY
jgi:hypothetical protein